MILGELLKKKDNEGVRVLMLVWDDRTSLKLLKKEGLMSAHDEDTITQNSIVYDTPYHSIFRTLDTVHHNDFLQPNFAEHETWNVQLFWSIDGGAAYGFPVAPEDAARVGIVCAKDNAIDRSIQDAYINSIRRGSVQAILNWRKRTTEMMYSDIAEALRTTDHFFALDIERERRPKNMNLQRDLNIIQITVELRKLGGS
ncbi:hypothetical protein POTOM_022788 [Populus tomentosa]|uniref:Uncharacterized protein n=1 Tax=Populus tomentosa TaxID=118781 RepID=A0A8X8CQ35_POPTO|nr:hypothetical protein POTOM_022788 [Populus tomentosa]